MEWKCGLQTDPCGFKTYQGGCNYTLACPKRVLDYKSISWQDKITTIKYLREHFDLGLKEAKDIVEIVTWCYANRPLDQELQVFGKGELLPEHEKELNSFNRTPEQKIIYALGMLGDIAERFSGSADLSGEDTARHIFDARFIIIQALQEITKP